MEKILDLKKGDKFRFNDCIYTVKRCYINDDKPLIAVDKNGTEERYYFDELEIEKVK